ncbi:penicillin-binding protein activator [Moritella viscosa]|uniref:Lipoprotein, putative n=1 Tax=Moritella viscosa TaxID=80854 RepID=A0A1K9ZY86_9GAMM|nr:penicillin-binding protein activator [Moritella viscosa]SGZ02190.1 Lipoprotein, putative [Moritella viscosa]SHO07082.1 Lipoprotein, putative [Moritella viscosa]SHO07211.1 Lipoprotein, putative [Moritella viscosa]SHO11025.1 Lipoprotein, putative [Moritella viscosa]SHO15316.1 Lipoprotein, putative [Moritella viscosa]
MEFKHSYSRLIMFFSLSLLLSACSSTTTSEKATSKPQLIGAPDVLTQIDQPAQYYIDKIALANKPQTISWQLLSARALITEGHPQPALDILSSVERNPLSTQQLFEVALIKSEAYLLEKRYHDAATILNFSSTLSTMKLAHWQRYYLLNATISELQNNNAKAVEYRVALNDFLDAKLHSTNNTRIWKLVTIIPTSELQQLTSQFDTENPTLSGWYHLGMIAQQYRTEPQLLIQNLQVWKTEYPQHPALSAFPIELVKAMAITPYAPSQIAVLAPLTGKRAIAGKAIRDGMLSAYYQDEEADRVNLRFYDTAETSADKLYLQAINDGADFVVGPLLKSNLTKVLPLVKEVPLISLNKLTEAPATENIFYFSLSSNDEVIAAAKKMQKDGIKQPLVLAPNNRSGNNLSAVFAKQWQLLTQDTSDIYKYKSRSDMQKTVTSLFSVTSSNQRINLMKNLVGANIKAKTRSRRDIDAIYIIATPSEAMLAIPYIITTQNPYAPQVAVYASSRTHGNNLSKSQNRDLNGLIFSDMPWLLNPDLELKQQTLALWPNMSKIQQNLFSMGYDSFKLIPNLLQLRNFPDLRLAGQTGILYINENGIIEREFSWAKYRLGKIRLEDTNAETKTTP